MDSRKVVEIQVGKTLKPSFLDLPVNVRFVIYRTLLVQQKPLTPLHRRGIERYFERDVTRKILLRAGIRLLQTCKKVLNEATTVLYSENTLSLRPEKWDEEIPEFLARIGRDNCLKISSLNINFEYSQQKRWRDGWCSQNASDYAVTEFEELFGFVDGNDFLPDYPIAGQVFFADIDTIQHSVPSHKYDESHFEWIQDFLEEEDDAYGSENLYDGYPQWDYEGTYVSNDLGSPYAILEALGSLRRCCRVRRLELWFPNPQRFALGYGLLKEDRMFLELLWPLHDLSELIIHGVDKLGIIESVVEHMNLSMVRAELNCSRVRPFLHVEAGRPNLRAEANWRVLQSNRYTLMMEIRKADIVPKDIFSGLPAEVRALIYDYLFPCWYENFHGAGRFDIGNIEHPYIMLQNLFSFCRCDEFERTFLTGAAALLGVSRLLHEEAATMIYRQYTFSTTSPDGHNHACCKHNDHRDSFHPDIGLLHHFLSQIGPKNRKRLRHLYMGLRAFVPFPRTSRQLQDPKSSGEKIFCHNIAFGWQSITTDIQWVLRRLLIQMQEIPVLHSFTLRFSNSISAEAGYFMPRKENEYQRLGIISRKHTLDANYFLNLLSRVKSLRYVEIVEGLGMTESELFARLVGAGIIAVRRNQVRSGVIGGGEARDIRAEDAATVDAQAKPWDWKKDDNGRHGCVVKRLTPNNMAPAVARRLWAARGIKDNTL